MRRDAKEEIKHLEKLLKKEKDTKVWDRIRAILILEKNLQRFI